MRTLAVLALLISATAHGAPLPNLALSCPDASAIGKPGVDSCRGYTYQLPTSELIVSSGSTNANYWRKASDLSGADTVLVCTIPVEPGQYSSCRDATGARRTAFVRKDSVISGGSVTVDQTGADYTDPMAAAQNAFAGDTWCVAPQWPAQPCVMALGDGVFILRETLTLGEGLVVAGAGKGATLLVADNGVNVAVATTGRARVSDLTIVNSQPGRAEATGLLAQGPVLELHEAVIEVGGAARSLGVGKRSVQSIEILDSEITVVGQDSTGIETLIPADPGSIMTLERSAVSAARTALDENEVDIGPQVRVVDSRVFGHIFYNPESSLLEIVRSQIVGNVGASNDNVRVRITDSHIKGSVGVSGLAAHVLDIIDTIIEGSVHADHSSGLTFDGLQLLGELRLEEAAAEIRRSYISSASTAAALSLGRAVSVELEQTFVQGAVAVAVEAASELQSSSSVLSGPISASTAAVISCTETYGADYELLSAVCQPQVP